MSPRTHEVRRVLDLVGLGDVATKRISRLSGGQRRRVALAQALLGTPELLVLDEPTTGLDPEQRASLRGVLADIAATSTMVISTHQTEDVAALCSRVVVLDAGRVHFDGTVPELVSLAAGKVWMAARPDRSAQASWRTASGALPQRRGARAARRRARRAQPRGRLPAAPRRPRRRRDARHDLGGGGVMTPAPRRSGRHDRSLRAAATAAVRALARIEVGALPGTRCSSSAPRSASSSPHGSRTSRRTR